jgi:hypothetical protein
MTDPIDTAAYRGHVGALPYAERRRWLDLCDALDAERAHTAQLTEALRMIFGETSDAGARIVAEDALAVDDREVETRP